MPRPFRGLSTIAAIVCATLALSNVIRAQTQGRAERFVANAVDLNRGASGAIEIVVNRWSTDKERDTLMSVMLNSGPEKLLNVLQDLPRTGYFRTPDSIGWDIHFARK